MPNTKLYWDNAWSEKSDVRRSFGLDHVALDLLKIDFKTTSMMTVKIRTDKSPRKLVPVSKIKYVIIKNYHENYYKKFILRDTKEILDFKILSMKIQNVKSKFK